MTSKPPMSEAPEWTGRFIVRLALPIEDALVRLHESQTSVQVRTLADVVGTFVPPAERPAGFDRWRGAPVAHRRAATPTSDVSRSIAMAPDVIPSLVELGDFLQTAAGLPPSSSVAAVPSGLAHKVVSLEWAARQSELPPLASLFAFYYLDARSLGPSSDAAESYAARLRSLSAIASAAPEPILVSATWKVTMDDLDQGYIKGGAAGPNRFRGINAAAPSVWGQVDGAPIGFVDFERGWDLEHPEFPRATLPQPLYNFASSDDSERTHGTAVLSVVLARDNADLVVGIAPGATFLGVVTPIQVQDSKDPADAADVVGALLGARQFMHPGDVLLIEQQLKTPGAVNYPMEATRPNLDAMRLLAASGVVVVQAGGNGGLNLDNPLPPVLGNVPPFSLNPNAPDFIDSGAVLVGSCRAFVLGLDPNDDSAPHHSPSGSSPRGLRVNCSAWGEDVEVVRTPTARDQSPTRADFNGTSSAAAIIAGAALLVQSLAVKKRGSPLTPLQLRYLLSNRALGTPIIENGVVICSMPNLSRIGEQLELLPDVFVGDCAGDDGARQDQLCFDSHDIVVRGAPIQGVTDYLGADSEFADGAPPSEPLDTGGTNFIYLRARNRGKLRADNVKLYLFWAEAGVMIPPNRWHFVAASDATDVPGRNGSKRAPVVVAPRVMWNATSANPMLPAAPASIALISVATHYSDPAPLFALPASASQLPQALPPNEALDYFNAHLQLLRSNNVGMRNRHLVRSVVSLQGGTRTGNLAFRLFGANGLPWLFDLELTTETPGIADVAILMPNVLTALVAQQLATMGLAGELDASGLHFPVKGSLRIPNIALPPDANFGCAVRVHATAPGTGVWNIAQIAQETVVGRLTFSLPA